jgi:tetraprenyl-beta-curcumene synthase
VLRGHALEALETKRTNLDGAAAFALLAPRRYRGPAVRAEVVFALLSDYLDTLSEQPSADPVANGLLLHLAQRAALDREAPWADYYTHHPRKDDGGYLCELVEACRAALGELRSYRVAAPAALRLSQHAGRFQSLNLTERYGGHDQLAQWVRHESTPHSTLYWWEAAAAANSTLGILALIGAGAQPGLRESDASAIEGAYRPWVEALHTLLDSVVDEDEDAAAGQRSLLSYYESPEQAASRLAMITEQALGALASLPDSSRHIVILSAMVGFYVCPVPPTATGPPVAEAVLEAIGPLAKPTALMFGAREALGKLGAWRPRLPLRTGPAGQAETAERSGARRAWSF